MWLQTQSFFLILSVIVTGSLSTPWDMVVPPEVTVSRGEDAFLSCSFTHPRQQQYSGEITVKWLAREPKASPFFICSVRNNSMDGLGNCSASGLKHSLAGDPRRGELSLLIRKTQLMDNERYFCRVELEVQRDSYQTATKLHVTAEPQILSLSVAETSPDSNSAPRRLQCEVEGHPLPEIVWLSASRKQIETRGESSPSGLYRLMSSVPYLEEEVLTCRAESELGDAERTYPPSDTLMITLVVCGLLLLLLLSAGVIIYYLRNRGVMSQCSTQHSGESDLPACPPLKKKPCFHLKRASCKSVRAGERSDITDSARSDSAPIYGNADFMKNHGQRACDSSADGDAEDKLVYSAVIPSRSTSSPPADVIGSRQHEETGVLYAVVNVRS
ncbi:sialic acid-binding Ig-like lectin 15 isoform X2 [Seriola aureovittata]|uniref:sialic acid-binding Ig-like lectin 15 isoform X2 n=1 Tax=Seriola aureovittata TaxID=2871759 RepID=UPI0024BDB1D7|nr:sialic acid-binding Ig-like lectin 15 isoform X2 [Seriola aureovittata]